ncbi:uncharacterized protein LOC143445698 [Clavelina lepadiformis]|uniref:uncharacterized protein LOC143445698 n=1 Tax=Clavelina lepadiformis TaxID=159417 RepID=UPI004041F624
MSFLLGCCGGRKKKKRGKKQKDGAQMPLYPDKDEQVNIRPVPEESSIDKELLDDDLSNENVPLVEETTKSKTALRDENSAGAINASHPSLNGVNGGIMNLGKEVEKGSSRRSSSSSSSNSDDYEKNDVSEMEKDVGDGRKQPALVDRADIPIIDEYEEVRFTESTSVPLNEEQSQAFTEKVVTDVTDAKVEAQNEKDETQESPVSDGSPSGEPSTNESSQPDEDLSRPISGGPSQASGDVEEPLVTVNDVKREERALSTSSESSSSSSQESSDTTKFVETVSSVDDKIVIIGSDEGYLHMQREDNLVLEQTVDVKTEEAIVIATESTKVTLKKTEYAAAASSQEKVVTEASLEVVSADYSSSSDSSRELETKKSSKDEDFGDIKADPSGSSDSSSSEEEISETPVITTKPPEIYEEETATSTDRQLDRPVSDSSSTSDKDRDGSSTADALAATTKEARSKDEIPDNLGQPILEVNIEVQNEVHDDKDSSKENIESSSSSSSSSESDSDEENEVSSSDIRKEAVSAVEISLSQSVDVEKPELHDIEHQTNLEAAADSATSNSKPLGSDEDVSRIEKMTTTTSDEDVSDGNKNVSQKNSTPVIPEPAEDVKSASSVDSSSADSNSQIVTESLHPATTPTSAKANNVDANQEKEPSSGSSSDAEGSAKKVESASSVDSSFADSDSETVMETMTPTAPASTEKNTKDASQEKESSSENSSDSEESSASSREEDKPVPETKQDADQEQSTSSSSSENEKEENSEEKPSQVEKGESAPSIDTVEISEAPKKKREEIVFKSGWRKMVRLLDLIQAKLVNEGTVKKLEDGSVNEEEVADDLSQYLCGKEPIAGILMMETGEKMSLNDASKNRTIRRGTAVSLLEAQAATGSIINPYNGAKMDVDEAVKEDLVDRFVSSALSRAEKAVSGYTSRLSDKPLSLFEAMKRNLIVQSHGIRLLEAQIATGGIIDPLANHRVPVDVAFERGLFDERLNKILEDSSDDTKGFFDPNTNENLTYLRLMERCIVDKETSLLLLPIYKKRQKKDYWKSHVTLP